jgi:hypothetical protein
MVLIHQYEQGHSHSYPCNSCRGRDTRNFQFQLICTLRQPDIQCVWFQDMGIIGSNG